jgi:hypothetical protein
VSRQQRRGQLPTEINIPNREERLRICRLMVGLAKEVNTDIFGAESNFGMELDTVFIACVVMIGHAEGRPMTANKIALYLGMPRTTVLRKLAKLLRLNIVLRSGAKYFVSPARLAGDHHLVEKLGRMISSAK